MSNWDNGDRGYDGRINRGVEPGTDPATEPGVAPGVDQGGAGPYGPVRPAGPGGVTRPAPSGRPRRVIDAGRLWFGGVMAGIVGAGVAFVGLLIARGILGIPVLVERKGHLVTATSWWYAVVSFVAAIAATAVLHALLAAAPQPYRFFNWIFGLAVAIAVLLPFSSSAGMDTKLAVALINLAVGLAIGSILSGIGRSAARILDEPYGY